MRLTLFLWWLRLTRPRSYHRLMRLWRWQLLDRICNIDPWPLMPKRTTKDIIEEWKVDAL